MARTKHRRASSGRRKTRRRWRTKGSLQYRKERKRTSRSRLAELARREQIVAGIVGPYQDHCSSFLNPAGPSTPNYINVCKLSIGIVKIGKYTKTWDSTTKGILSYDRAETNDAYLGQLNIVAASSFISPEGLLWGHDIAAVPLGKPARGYIRGVPIHSINPLLEAGQALLGNNRHSTRYLGQTGTKYIRGLRFYIRPGEIQPCAVKSATGQGPGVIWCAMAIAIPIDSQRSRTACLFYEDAGFYAFPGTLAIRKTGSPPKAFIAAAKRKLERKMREIATAQIMNARDQIIPVVYDKIYVGYRMAPVAADELAKAITLSPYIRLAKLAVPGYVERLVHMSLSDWERSMKDRKRFKRMKKNRKQRPTTGLVAVT